MAKTERTNSEGSVEHSRGIREIAIKNGIVWVEDPLKETVHAVPLREGDEKKISLCEIKIQKWMSFRSLYDFSRYEKCASCLDRLSSIYRNNGILT